jgi:hypothetical protein
MSVRNGFLVTAALGLLCAGCATNANRPTSEITRARTLIEQAEKSGAQQYAASDLDQARNKLRLANAAVEAGKNDEARARANEAASSAELAQARATSGQAKKAADEIQNGTDTLEREANRNQGAAKPPQP